MTDEEYLRAITVAPLPEGYSFGHQARFEVWAENGRMVWAFYDRDGNVKDASWLDASERARIQP